MRFAIWWWVSCWAVLAAALFFGIDAVPRFFNHDIYAAFLFGAVFAVVSIAPIIYLSFVADEIAAMGARGRDSAACPPSRCPR